MCEGGGVCVWKYEVCVEAPGSVCVWGGYECTLVRCEGEYVR